MKVNIFGYSGHAYVVCDALTSSGYEPKGYLTKEKLTTNPYTLEYLGFEDDRLLLESLKDTPYFVAIGSNKIRKKLQTFLLDIMGKPINAIHETAVLSSFSKVGSGVLFAPNAVLNSHSKVSDGCIINSGAIIEHECTIGSFSHIAPGAVLAGNVTVGDSSFIGANSTIIQGINIGCNVTVGAGSVIIRDIPDNVTVVGNPGRIIKTTTI